jgi:hypothetical protein
MKPTSWVKALLAVAFLALAASIGNHPSPALAAASQASDTTTRIIRGSVSFTLPADTCPAFPAGVSLSGTGERYQVITTKVKPDGRTLVVSNDFIQGTAQDSNGGTYTFLYSNQDRNRAPASGSPIKVHMIDVFTLNGNGSISDFTVAFNWTWKYTPPEGEWPPNHNWQQLYTLGDPLHCDPL